MNVWMNWIAHLPRLIFFAEGKYAAYDFIRFRRRAMPMDASINIDKEMLLVADKKASNEGGNTYDYIRFGWWCTSSMSERMIERCSSNSSNCAVCSIRWHPSIHSNSLSFARRSNTLLFCPPHPPPSIIWSHLFACGTNDFEWNPQITTWLDVFIKFSCFCVFFFFFFAYFSKRLSGDIRRNMYEGIMQQQINKSAIAQMLH